MSSLPRPPLPLIKTHRTFAICHHTPSKLRLFDEYPRYESIMATFTGQSSARLLVWLRNRHGNFLRRSSVITYFSPFVLSYSASSQQQRPLKRLAHPSSLTLDIVPRQSIPSTSLRSRSIPLDTPTLLYSDSFRLSITAFSRTYHLHLRPNDHLIHPAARINYYRNSPDGGPSVLDRTEPLVREEIRVYWGEAVHQDETTQRMREDAAGGLYRGPQPAPHVLGWARIMVHDQGDSDTGPTFEGAFTINGVVHHVTTKENYYRNKHLLDPDTEADHPYGNLVIFRDSDLISEDEIDGSETEPAGRTCAHDNLPFNVDNLHHPVLRFGAGLDQPTYPVPWYDNLGDLDEPHTSRLKRGDVGNGGMNVSSKCAFLHFWMRINAERIFLSFLNAIGNSAGCPKTQKIVRPSSVFRFDLFTYACYWTGLYGRCG